MAHSFSAQPGVLSDSQPQRRRVLVTGAAGNIGSYFAQHSGEKYDLRLMVMPGEDASEIALCGEVVEADLSDIEALKQHCEGVDTVVNMAGNASPETVWSALLDTNIVGVYNMMVAAKAAGCRRLIHASSIHAVSGYPADVQVKTSEPVNPGDLYGVSKCFAEALGRYMAEQEDLSVICLRIGAFQPLSSVRSDDGLGLLDGFVSQRDLNQLIEKCIDVESLKFAILHGLSDNRFKRLDISDARELVGYAPQDDAARELPGIKELELNETLSTHGQIQDGGKSGLRAELDELKG